MIYDCDCRRVASQQLALNTMQKRQNVMGNEQKQNAQPAQMPLSFGDSESMGVVQTANLEGSCRTLNGLAGIELQCCRYTELESVTVQATLQPSLVVVILLQGELCFGLDEERFRLSAIKAPVGLVYNIIRPTVFSRGLLAGNHIEKIVLSIEQATALRICEQACFTPLRHGMLDEQLFHYQWCADAAQIAESRQMLLGLDAPADLATLNQQAHALRLLQLVLQMLQPLENSQLHENKNDGMDLAARIDAIIDGQTSGCPPLVAIAQSLNMSSSKLQRLFKQQYNRTVMDYIRCRRLLMAQQAMREQSISIGEAAFKAGYNHCSNFCLAFKRQFGYNPGELKKTLGER